MLKPKLAPEEFEALDINLNADDVKGLYKRIDTDGQDPKFVLEIEGLTDSLKSALRKERENARMSNAKIQELGAMLTDVQQKLEAFEGVNLSSVESMQDSYDTLVANVSELTKAQSVQAALREHRAFDALGPMFVNEHVKTEVTKEGVRTYVEYDGEQISVSDYVTQLGDACGDRDHGLWHPELARQFKRRSAASGGGTPAGGHKPVSSKDIVAVRNLQRRNAMSTKQKTEYIKAHGEDAFMRLPA